MQINLQPLSKQIRDGLTNPCKEARPMLVSNGAREHALSAIALYNRFRISSPLHSGDDGSFRRDKGCRSVSVLHEPQV